MSMTHAIWWEEPLSAFAEAFGTECEVLRDTRTSVRSVGEWWKREGHWQVQLDKAAFARFSEGSTLSDAARRLLSSTLESGYASSGSEASWQNIVTSHFSELLCSVNGTSGVHLQEQAQLVERMSIRELRLPGYFACIEFAGFGQEAEDFRALVEDIFAEFEAVQFLGWATHPSNLHTALIFVAGGLLLQSLEQHEPDEDFGGVHEFFSLLVGTLESEALVAAKATAGSVVSHPKEWHKGLFTVIQAWREHYRFAPEESVYVWGQQPVLFLLSALPQEAILEFLRMVSTGSAGGSLDILLSTELAETLDGFLKANLNVSEASRLLYLHRNTLMNRLDRIRQQTGHDVRKFEDALVLWLAQSLLAYLGETRVAGQ